MRNFGSSLLGVGKCSKKAWNEFHAKDATIAKRCFHVAEFFKDRFSRTCIKKELFLFSISSVATL